MHFKLWLEERLSHDSVKRIILDALDANNGDSDAVLGSLVSEQPQLIQKLNKYSILQPHLSNIKEYIDTHPQSNLIELIDFIMQLGNDEI